MHDGLAQPAGQGRVPQFEEGRADLGDGVVELVDGLGDSLDDQVTLREARQQVPVLNTSWSSLLQLSRIGS